MAAQNQRHLNDLNQMVLRRSEMAVSYSAQVLAEASSEGGGDCSDAAQQANRLRVYQNNMLKDIRTVDGDGAVRCSAYSETLEFDKSWPQMGEMLHAASEPIRLFKAERFASEALGVLREAVPASPIVAIVGIDASQLDVLPGDLRDHGRVSLVLDNGQAVATFQTDRELDENSVSFERHSQIYPMRSEIVVEGGALVDAETAPSTGVMLIFGACGLACGVLASRSIGRPPNALAELDRAIAAREFKPYFQPIFALKDGRIVGCETLMRWVQPDGRIVGPALFMALAERSRRIEVMTWHLLEEALASLRPVMANEPEFKVTVNVTPRHLLAHDFIDRLSTIVATGAAKPSQIVLEITERDELSDLDAAAAAIAALQKRGFRVAIDDVGVGHSGLSYIQRLGANTLKIDKFFVDALGQHDTAHAVIEMLVRLGRELGMTIVAEGIETEAQLCALKACHVDEGQGYIVSPALPGLAFLDLFRSLAGGFPNTAVPPKQYKQAA